MKDTSAQFAGEQPVTSVSSAKELLESHHQVKAEIDAREDNIQKISRAANKLIQQGHYAKTDVCFTSGLLSNEKSQNKLFVLLRFGLVWLICVMSCPTC